MQVLINGLSEKDKLSYIMDYLIHNFVTKITGNI